MLFLKSLKHFFERRSLRSSAIDCCGGGGSDVAELHGKPHPQCALHEHGA